MTKKGKACRAAATAGGLCYFHANPNKAAELGRIGGRSKRPTVPENAEPLPTLNSAVAVRDTVDRLIADVYAGKLHPRIAGGLAPLLQLQLRALDATDVEQRIAKLERLAARREKSSKTNQSQSRTQFAAGLAPVSAPLAPAPEKQSEHRPVKVEAPLPAANRVGGPTNNGAAHDLERESEQRLARMEEPLPVGSEEDRPTNHVAAPGLEKESEQRVTKKEEPVPSETREAGPMDRAAVLDSLQQALREGEKAFPPEKRGWLGLK